MPLFRSWLFLISLIQFPAKSPHGRIRTPNINKLALEGMLFTDAYAGEAVCAPSRCSLMTGLHTGHTPIRGNKPVKGKDFPLPEQTVTVAQVFHIFPPPYTLTQMSSGTSCCRILHRGNWKMGLGIQRHHRRSSQTRIRLLLRSARSSRLPQLLPERYLGKRKPDPPSAK